MLESVLGLDILRSGLMDYLNEHKFDNADTEDLWDALSANTNETMKVKVSKSRKIGRKTVWM